MLQWEPKDMTVEELLDEQDNPPYPFEDMKTMTFKKLGELQQRAEGAANTACKNMHRGRTSTQCTYKDWTCQTGRKLGINGK